MRQVQNYAIVMPAPSVSAKEEEPHMPLSHTALRAQLQTMRLLTDGSASELMQRLCEGCLSSCPELLMEEVSLLKLNRAVLIEQSARRRISLQGDKRTLVRRILVENKRLVNLLRTAEEQAIQTKHINTLTFIASALGVPTKCSKALLARNIAQLLPLTKENCGSLEQMSHAVLVDEARALGLSIKGDKFALLMSIMTASGTYAPPLVPPTEVESLTRTAARGVDASRAATATATATATPAFCFDEEEEEEEEGNRVPVLKKQKVTGPGVFVPGQMGLLQLTCYPSTFYRVLGFMGTGYELCLALASKHMLNIVAQTSQDSQSTNTQSIMKNHSRYYGNMQVPALQHALKMAGLDANGRKHQLFIRLTAWGLPRRSAVYFLSSASLREYTTTYLGMRELLTDDELGQVMQIIAGNGVLEGIKTLRQFNPPVAWDPQKICAAAAGGGHLKLLKWLRRADKKEGECQWDEWTCAYAARGGHLKVLKWLRQLGKPEGQCPWNTRACWYAAEAGHRDVLLWLRRVGKPEGQCPWDMYTCAFAAKGGQLEALRWLRRPGKPEGQCEWNESTCANAAEKGHLEVLQWLRQPGKLEGQCPWSADTCHAAAKGGHLQVLQWLRIPKYEDVCPWNIYTCLAAARANRLQLLQWLRSGKEKDKCPWKLSWCLAVTTSVDLRNWLVGEKGPVMQYYCLESDSQSEPE